MKQATNFRPPSKHPFSYGRLIQYVGLLWAGMFMIHCASQVSPQGGEPDKIPPTIKRTYPENQSLNVTDKSFVFLMSEPVKLPSYGKEIFISPLLESRPNISLSDNTRRLRIRFQDDLRPQTTYVISLTGIQDFYGNNAMTGSYLYAFSTGDQLDSMEISGKVLAGGNEAPVEDILLLLFDADSIQDNNIFRKQPAYVSKTDASGTFKFQYLRQIAYRIYGIKDVDQSNTYSQPAELIALAKEAYVVPSDSLAELTLYASLPDNQAPLFKNYAWIHDSTLIVSFDEISLEKNVSISLTDSSGQDTAALTFFTRLPNAEFEYLIQTSKLDSVINKLVIEDMEDSLGNIADTSILVRSTRRRTLEEPVYIPPAFNLPRKEMELYLSEPFIAGDTTFFFLSDTTKYDFSSIDTSEADLSTTEVEATYPNRYNAEYKSDGFRVVIEIGANVPRGEPLLLHVDGQITQIEDSVFIYPLSWPDPKNFGTLSGSVQVQEYDGPIIVELVANGKATQVSYDSLFSYSLINPGNYQIRVTLDVDSNQIWTPGSLSPYRLPEKILLDSRQENIRANWDIEDYLVELNANQTYVPPVSSDSTEIEEP